ncbi:hypothetical protein MNBD_DELTA01-25 [hydrothermal vent metagenome]|uniref:Type IV pilus biogenesis protein PilP n=1 Tax=hydrothermal vent metagenome TaxID=652676 RepID=A0A3B0QKA1_9ZZZZ
MNKRNLLIVLAIVWVVVLAYNFGLFGGSKGAEQADQRLRRSRQVAAAKDFPTLKSEKLQKKRSAFKKVRKDIFSPFSGVSRGPSPSVMPVAAAQAQLSSASPLEQLISELSFIGFVESAKEKTIFLGMGDDVVLVKEGVSIAGLARVIKITDRKMTLGGIYGASDKRYEISLE